MKSIRLSKATRKEIVANVMKHKLKESPSPFDLDAESAVIGDAIYKSVYGKLPFSEIKPNFFNTDNELKVCYKNSTDVFSVKMSTHVPVPMINMYRQAVTAIPASFKKQFIALEDKRIEVNAWEEERKEARAQLEEILGAVNTTGQLLDLWPEMVDFLPSYLKDPTEGITLPALQLDTLNKNFGIKSK